MHTHRLFSLLLLGVLACGGCSQEPADVGGACKGDITCKKGLICSLGQCVSVPSEAEVFKTHGAAASQTLDALRHAHTLGTRVKPASVAHGDAIFSKPLNFERNALLVDQADLSLKKGSTHFGRTNKAIQVVVLQKKGPSAQPDRDGSFKKSLIALAELKYACVRHVIEQREGQVGDDIKEKNLIGEEKMKGKSFIPGSYKAAVICYELAGGKAVPVGSTQVVATHSENLTFKPGQAKEALAKNLEKNIDKAWDEFRGRFKAK